MIVKAKFYVQSVERYGQINRIVDGKYDETAVGKPETTSIKVNLAPVYAPKDAKCENASYWSATPSGQLWMQINNPAAFDAFKEGQEFYLTFTPADEA